jgi:hypothetical protein
MLGIIGVAGDDSLLPSWYTSDRFDVIRRAEKSYRNLEEVLISGPPEQIKKACKQSI